MFITMRNKYPVYWQRIKEYADILSDVISNTLSQIDVAGMIAGLTNKLSTISHKVQVTTALSAGLSTSLSSSLSTGLAITRTALSSLSKIDINKLDIILTVIWWQAWVILKFTKLFELCLRALLKLPDKFMVIPHMINKPIMTTDGKKITILNAYNEAGIITNKLKLFLQVYWETGGLDKAYDENGFSFDKFRQMFGCSVLYCSYLLNNIEIENTNLDKIRRSLIVKMNALYVKDGQEVDQYINFDQLTQLNQSDNREPSPINEHIPVLLNHDTDHIDTPRYRARSYLDTSDIPSIDISETKSLSPPRPNTPIPSTPLRVLSMPPNILPNILSNTILSTPLKIEKDLYNKSDLTLDSNLDLDISTDIVT